MEEPTREYGTYTELHYIRSLSSDSGVPLACAEVKCNQKLSIVHRTKATSVHNHGWKALAEVVEVVERHCSQWGHLQLPPESGWDSSPIFVATKVASQHTWQAPRWIGKLKEERIYYTHNSDAIHTQTR